MVYDSDINLDKDPEFEGKMDLDKSELDLESSSNLSTEFGEQGDGKQSKGGQGNSKQSEGGQGDSEQGKSEQGNSKQGESEQSNGA
ncbi:hypothetical protein EYZ11_013164 [Aspergillus tanneri]|uniref:Uncharacterized protein n=1 Tax=Aspergillus tanneri TaxID=1220188 RepID=A0A4S3IYC6_9EURO|nr:hypothetical protein EYZ11_013164 [Aspergillus tanneri]